MSNAHCAGPGRAGMRRRNGRRSRRREEEAERERKRSETQSAWMRSKTEIENKETERIEKDSGEGKIRDV